MFCNLAQPDGTRKVKRSTESVLDKTPSGEGHLKQFCTSNWTVKYSVEELWIDHQRIRSPVQKEHQFADSQYQLVGGQLEVGGWRLEVRS